MEKLELLHVQVTTEHISLCFLTLLKPRRQNSCIQAEFACPTKEMQVVFTACLVTKTLCVEVAFHLKTCVWKVYQCLFIQQDEISRCDVCTTANNVNAVIYK